MRPDKKSRLTCGLRTCRHWNSASIALMIRSSSSSSSAIRTSLAAARLGLHTSSPGWNDFTIGSTGYSRGFATSSAPSSQQKIGRPYGSSEAKPNSSRRATPRSSRRFPFSTRSSSWPHGGRVWLHAVIGGKRRMLPFPSKIAAFI